MHYSVMRYLAPLRFAAGPILLAAILGAAAAVAQTAPEGAAPGDGAQKLHPTPDACDLLPLSDLEARYPGRSVANNQAVLAPSHRAPPYTVLCAYVVMLGNARDEGDARRRVKLNILSWGDDTVGRGANTLGAAREALANEPEASNAAPVDPVAGVGDEAFLAVSDDWVQIVGRKGDLIFELSVQRNSPQSVPDAIALAAQLAKRWQRGVGIVQADSPIEPGPAPTPAQELAARARPGDGRSPVGALQGAWPDACTLLPADDVKAVFPEINVGAPLKTPAPLGVSPAVEVKAHSCGYKVGEGAWIEGKRGEVAAVELQIENAARTVADARRHYAMTAGVGQSDAIITGLDTDPEVAGLADEARMGILNVLHLRKGLLTVKLSVHGHASFDENRRRLVALAKKVAPRLP